MATKWIKFNRRGLTKLIVFALLVTCLMLSTFSALTINLKVKNYESISEKDYMKSNTISDDIRYAASRLEYVLRHYKSEQYIRMGGTVKDLAIKDSWQLSNLYNNFITENQYEYNSESEELFWKEKHDEIQEIKDIIKKSDLSNYQQIIDELNNPSGLEYFATDNENICTNTENTSKSYFASKKASLLIDEEGVQLTPKNGENTYSASLTERFQGISEGSDQVKIYIALTDEGLTTRTEKWDSDRNILVTNIAAIIICIIISIICVIALTASAGMRVMDEELHLIFWDKIFTDLDIAAMISVVLIVFVKFDDVMNIRYTNENLMVFAMVSSVGAIAFIFTSFYLSVVKHIKNKTAITYSLIYIVLSKLIISLIKIVRGGPLMVKSIGGVIALMGLTSLCVYYYAPLLVAVLIIACLIVYTKVKTFRTIQQGVRIAKEGDYEHKINLTRNGEFKKLSDDINTITDGFKIAVQNKVKSEKLKTELITNVSHDIKTPLTSIISYVDLLKREGLNSPNALKYLDVLDRKSNRLKTLTEDLFEAAKVTSGSITVNFQKLNLGDLVSQVMGELDEKIQESQLDFRINQTEEKIYANADGRLLSRVMENLLSNIFKYAQKPSRVYIDIVSEEKEVSVCFKNVSANQLNIPVDELMERFKRGDESRNSEGNGLGLAIARSLMEIQKGVLKLSIDGDLFKAEIVLNKYFDEEEKIED